MIVGDRNIHSNMFEDQHNNPKNWPFYVQHFPIESNWKREKQSRFSCKSSVRIHRMCLNSTSDGNENVNGYARLHDLFLNGLKLEKAGDSDAAWNVYATCIRESKHFGKPWQRMALITPNNARRRRRILQLAIKYNPTNSQLYQSLGIARFDCGDVNGARDAFREGVRSKPDHGPLFNAWASLESYCGYVERSRALLHRGIKVEAGNERYSCRLLVSLAALELKCEDFDKALAAAQKATREQPYNSWCLQVLGVVHLKRGEFKEAVVWLRRALQLGPYSAETSYALGIALWRTRNIASARDVFTSASKKPSCDARLLHGWACFESAQGDLALSRSLLKRALKLNALDAIVWSELARLETRARNISDARQCFRQALKLNPRDWTSLEHWSAMEWNQGNHALSEQLLQRAFAIRFNAQGEFSILANSLADRPRVSSKQLRNEQQQQQSNEANS